MLNEILIMFDAPNTPFAMMLSSGPVPCWCEILHIRMADEPPIGIVVYSAQGDVTLLVPKEQKLLR